METRHAIPDSTADKSIKKYCQYTREASYTRDISYHRANKLATYKAVYEIKFHRQKLTQNTEKEVNHKKKRRRKRRRRTVRARTVRARTRTTKSKGNQTKCNVAIINQTQRKKQPKFKASDMVPVKIDKVNKTSPQSPTMLLGKMTVIAESGFVKVVTHYVNVIA